MPQLTPEDIDALARKRAGAKMGWYIHATIYVLVNLYWYLTLSFSSFKPLLGWGIGLALHGVSVFVLGKGSSMRERMVQRERERILHEQQNRGP
jgi:hypothetical protein